MATSVGKDTAASAGAQSRALFNSVPPCGTSPTSSSCPRVSSCEKTPLPWRSALPTWAPPSGVPARRRRRKASREGPSIIGNSNYRTRSDSSVHFIGNGTVPYHAHRTCGLVPHRFYGDVRESNRNVIEHELQTRAIGAWACGKQQRYQARVIKHFSHARFQFATRSLCF